MKKMNAAVLEQHGRIVWKETDMPVAEGNEALIRVSHAGICGSDQHVFLVMLLGRSIVNRFSRM